MVHPLLSRRQGGDALRRVAPRALLLSAGVLALAALSLLASRTTATDPTAWLIWGRELLHGHLTTSAGPSWKPLPVAFTTLFALLGHDVAPAAWLVVSRGGALAALVLAARVAARLGGGRAGGVVAAALLVLTTDFVYDAGRGDSEGILVALALAAVDQLMSGRQRLAFVLAALAGLVRPELAPVLVVWGVLLWRADRSPGMGALVLGAGTAVVALWLVPERVGAGAWFGAASRALVPAPRTPGQTAVPFLAVFVSGAIVPTFPAWFGAAEAVVQAWRPRPRRADHRVVLGMAAAAGLLTLTVATLAQAGFTGNYRYLLLPAAFVAVLGGVGFPSLVARFRAAGAAPVWLAALVFGIAGIAVSGVLLAGRIGRLLDDQRVYGRQLPELIARAGGEAGIRRCGPIGASLLQRMALAWRLDLRTVQVLRGVDPRAGTVFAFTLTDASRRPTPPVQARLGPWVVRSSCRVAPAAVPRPVNPPRPRVALPLPMAQTGGDASGRPHAAWGGTPVR